VKRTLPCVVAAVLALACQPPAPTPLATGAKVPDFHLLDVNPASARAGQQVSPRDLEGQVTGWYFGHSS
jgi:hypothetical protein